MASPATSGDSPKSLSSASGGTNPVPSFPLRWDEQEWGAHPKADVPLGSNEDIDRLLDDAFLSGENPLGYTWEDDEDSDASSGYVPEEESDIDVDVEMAELLDEDEPPEDRASSWDDSDVNADDDDDDEDAGDDDGGNGSDGNSGGDDAVIAIPSKKRRLCRPNQ
jgi:hypothetical protein